MHWQPPTFEGPRTSLDFTHVLYDDSSLASLFLALITLSPILLMASYAALAVMTREYLILVMWTGQFAGEGLNLVIKGLIKQERPIENIGNGYGFPSSHSQYMAYFTTFLLLHMYFRHRFSSTGSKVIDTLWRVCVYLALLLWTGLVAYSRYSLGYHNLHQIFWGLVIGSLLGAFVYICAQLLPTMYPHSVLGQIKAWIISNPLSTWFQLRDGWDVYPDGGREGDWIRWRRDWEAKHLVRAAKSKSQ